MKTKEFQLWSDRYILVSWKLNGFHLTREEIGGIFFCAFVAAATCLAPSIGF